MKGSDVNKIILIWLLTVVFISPLVTKSIHAYQEECFGEYCASADENHCSGHDCNTCPICHFAFSLFTETDFFTSNDLLPAFNCPVVVSYEEKGYNSILSLHYLRAPPIV